MPKNRLVVLGIGHAACRLLARCSLPQPVLKRYVPRLHRPPHLNQNQSWRERLQQETAETLQLIQAPEAVRVPDTFTHHLTRDNRVLLFAALGRHTGSVGVVAFSHRLQTQGIPARVLATLPFAFEGHTARRIAAQARRQIPFTDAATFPDLNELTRAVPALSSADAFRQADQRLLELLQKIVTHLYDTNLC